MDWQKEVQVAQYASRTHLCTTTNVLQHPILVHSATGRKQVMLFIEVQFQAQDYMVAG